MADYIKKIKAENSSSAKTYDIYAISADTALASISAVTASQMAGIWVNTKGNFEINSNLANYPSESTKNDAKLNLVSDNAIQIKPGNDKNLQLDCERNEKDKYEYGVKTCNGEFSDNKRVIALKLNTAEVTLDNQDANTEKFDTDSMDIKFRYNKWNGGEWSGNTGPIQAKMKARSFDIRCHDHGGIALQIAGRDSKNHENKIKFESDRIEGLGEILSDASYCKEGGKGMEFGTFNNEHTSLYTGDYRFKGDAKVFGVTRGELSATTSGKIDYPTQGDDFKDILPETGATWNEIIEVALGNKQGSGFTTEEKVREIVAQAQLSGSTVDLSNYYKKSETYSKEEVDAKIQSGVTPVMSGYATTEAVNAVDAKVSEVSANTEIVKFMSIPVDKGNLELNIAGLYHYTSPDNKDIEILTSAATRSIETSAGTVVCANTPSNITLESKGIVKSKADNGVEFESAYIGMGCKLSKKGKFSYAGYETAALSSLTQVMTEIEKLSLKVVIENNCTNDKIQGVDTIQTVSVPLYKLIKLIDKVTELESKVTGLETRVAALEEK